MYSESDKMIGAPVRRRRIAPGQLELSIRFLNGTQDVGDTKGSGMYGALVLQVVMQVVRAQSQMVRCGPVM